jgi:hypothetical protein
MKCSQNYGKRYAASTFVVDFSMEIDSLKMSEIWRDKMTRSRVEYLVAFLFLGILSACGGEDASEVVSPAAVGIAAPGGVAAVPAQ